MNTGSHAVFDLYVHLVFVAKYRRKIFTKVILNDLRKIFEEVCGELEATLIELDGEQDHVHLLVNYPPKVSISTLVNSIRQKKYRSIREKLRGNALWSPSYFAGSCGGAPISIIRQYIEQQKTPD